MVKIPYEGVSQAGSKCLQKKTRRAIGRCGFSVVDDRQPISDFLLALFNTNKPFHDVFNENPLNDIAVRNILIDVKKVGDATLYILYHFVQFGQWGGKCRKHQKKRIRSNMS